MDPVTHTLTGVALARAGLSRVTPLATATLIIAANIPDVDVLAYVRGPEYALAFRRGWTHGVLALAIWPFVVAGLMLLWHRLASRPPAFPPRFWPLTLIATIGVLSHPLLDWLNVYGMRWLMPFDGRWFYGDALFIVDPLVWVVLVVGVWRASARRARMALGTFAAYVLMMYAGTEIVAGRVRADLTAVGSPPSRIMASPEPLMPWRRWIVAAGDQGYWVGPMDRGGPDLTFIGVGSSPGVEWAAQSERAGWFLSWARFPYYEAVGSDTIAILDARYALDRQATFGVVTVWRDAVPDH